jgi:polycomb protein EED
MLATGNQVGKIYLWDLRDIPHYIDDYIEKKKAEHPVTKREKSVVKKKRGISVVNKKTSDLTDALASESSSRVSESAVIRKPTLLDSDSCESTIRQVDFSKDRQWIVAVCDDDSIWCWESNIDTKFQESINKDKDDKIVIRGSGSSEDDPLIVD